MLCRVHQAGQALLPGQSRGAVRDRRVGDQPLRLHRLPHGAAGRPVQVLPARGAAPRATDPQDKEPPAARTHRRHRRVRHADELRAHHSRQHPGPGVPGRQAGGRQPQGGRDRRRGLRARPGRAESAAGSAGGGGGRRHGPGGGDRGDRREGRQVRAAHPGRTGRDRGEQGARGTDRRPHPGKPSVRGRRARLPGRQLHGHRLPPRPVRHMVPSRSQAGQKTATSRSTNPPTSARAERSWPTP